MQYIRVWDLPLRLFHWVLVIAVIGAIVTVKQGGNMMIWHERFGLTIIGLLTFRLTWGLLGTRYARFAQFFPTPARWRDYIAGRWPGLGHNPLGSLSVFALLLLFGFQAVSGLFTYDDISFGGPLRSLLSNATVDRITTLHHDMEWWLYGLVALHVAAIIIYAVRGNNLLGPMIHGRKAVPEKQAGEDAGRARPWAMLVAIGVALFAVWLASGGWISAPPPPPAAVPAW